MKMVRLLKLLVVRNFREEKALTLLSILGVALGIAVFVGVKIAVDRATVSFEADIQGIDPRYTHEILSVSGLDFQEEVYRAVRMVEGKSYPLISTVGYLPDLDESVVVNGIYTVRMTDLLKGPEGEGLDLEGYFSEPGGVFVSKRFAETHGLTRGDSLEVSAYDRFYTLNVVGLLDSTLVPPNTMVMDLGNYQEHFGKAGYITKIDLTAGEEEVRKLGEIIPPDLSIERKKRVIENKRALLSSFRYNLLFVSLISVLVGMFLLYNTIFVSVVKRRREIGILRALGIGKKRVMLLFTIQGTLLGLAGSILGIFLGQLFAYLSIYAVEKTLTTVYGGVSMESVLLTGPDALESILLGVLVSLAASLIPSYESTRVRPVESTKEGSLEGRYLEHRHIFTALGFFFACGGVLLWYVEYRQPPFDFPYLSYGGILLFILGFTLISPHYLRFVLRVIRGSTGRIFRGTGKVALAGIDGSLYRFSVALMSVAISSALVFALLASIYSLRSSLKEWIGRNITADVYIKPSSCVSNYCFSPLSSEVVETVRGFKEVELVDRFRVLKVDFGGRPVIAGFGDTAALRKYRGRFNLDPGTKERLMELAREKQVSISDYLSVKHGLGRGDEVEISTPKGKEVFRVNNSFISYSTTSGFLYFDRKWLRAFWGLDDATQVSVYLKEGHRVGAFVDTLKSRFKGRYALEITDRGELRRRILSIFDRSFAITYAMELIAILVSLIGMVNALLVLVLEKKREMSVIRYLGGSWEQIRNMILLSSGIVGMAGIALGILMGPAISMVIIHVINRLSFGWEVSFKVPPLSLFLLTALLFLTALGAGLIPSRVARKIDPKAFVSFE